MKAFSEFARSCAASFSLLLLCACAPVAYHTGEAACEARMETGDFVTSDCAVLPMREWQPRDVPVRAVIVALHGFNDYSNFFDIPGRFFSRQGIACYAYDQRGFGGTSRRGFWRDQETYANDVRAFVAEVRKKHPAIPVYLLGESMGGAVTISAMTAAKPPDVDGVILVGPAVWGREFMPWYQRWLLSFTAHTVPWLELTGNSLGIWPSDNKEMLRAFARDPLVIKATRIDAVYGLANLMDEALTRADRLRQPTLVQYGEHDQVIPREPVLHMLEKMPEGVRSTFYKHGYHMLLRDLHAEEPMADVAAWIADHDAPVPHGTPIPSP